MPAWLPAKPPLTATPSHSFLTMASARVSAIVTLSRQLHAWTASQAMSHASPKWSVTFKLKKMTGHMFHLFGFTWNMKKVPFEDLRGAKI